MNALTIQTLCAFQRLPVPLPAALINKGDNTMLTPPDPLPPGWSLSGWYEWQDLRKRNARDAKAINRCGYLKFLTGWFGLPITLLCPFPIIFVVATLFIGLFFLIIFISERIEKKTTRRNLRVYHNRCKGASNDSTPSP